MKYKLLKQQLMALYQPLLVILFCTSQNENRTSVAMVTMATGLREKQEKSSIRRDSKQPLTQLIEIPN